MLPCYLFRDLPNVVDTEDTCIPLLLIDTAGCNLSELDVACNESKGNEGEYLILCLVAIDCSLLILSLITIQKCLSVSR